MKKQKSLGEALKTNSMIKKKLFKIKKNLNKKSEKEIKQMKTLLEQLKKKAKNLKGKRIIGDIALQTKTLLCALLFPQEFKDDQRIPDMERIRKFASSKDPQIILEMEMSGLTQKKSN